MKESGYRLYPASEGYKEALEEGTEGTGFVGSKAVLTGQRGYSVDQGSGWIWLSRTAASLIFLTHE